MWDEEQGLWTDCYGNTWVPDRLGGYPEMDFFDEIRGRLRGPYAARVAAILTDAVYGSRADLERYECEYRQRAKA